MVVTNIDYVRVNPQTNEIEGFEDSAYALIIYGGMTVDPMITDPDPNPDCPVYDYYITVIINCCVVQIHFHQHTCPGGFSYSEQTMDCSGGCRGGRGGFRAWYEVNPAFPPF